MLQICTDLHQVAILGF